MERGTYCSSMLFSPQPYRDVPTTTKDNGNVSRWLGGHDGLGRNVLTYAVLGNKLKYVKLLLKSGICVNDVDNFNRTALHWAVLKNHVECARLLLCYGADCKIRDAEGATPLHIASITSSCLSLILKHFGPDEVDIPDDDKRTALHWSAYCGLVENVRLLIHACNLSIASRDIEGKTPLHWAACSPSETAADCIRLFLANKNGVAAINLHDYDGRTALHCAVIEGALSHVEEIISVQACNVDLMDNLNCTPLHWATILNRKEIVSTLLLRGASITIHDINGATPLHYASSSVEIVKEFLYKSCVVDQSDHDCFTPLMWAASKDAVEVIHLLHKFGADLKAVDSHGFTALHVAALSGHVPAIRTLIELGARIDAVDELGRTALYYSCEMGHVAAIRTLLDCGFNAKVVDSRGLTCLHWAALKGQTTACSFLIACGCNTNATDLNGRTPLLCAASKGYIDCMSLLIESGGDLSLQDKEGWTALHWACKHGYLDAVKILVDYKVNLNRMAHSGDRVTPLDLAVINYRFDVAEFLLKRGAVSIAHIREMAACVIQATYRGYKVRKLMKKKSQKISTNINVEFHRVKNGGDEAIMHGLETEGNRELRRKVLVGEMHGRRLEKLSSTSTVDFSNHASEDNIFGEDGMNDMFDCLNVSSQSGAIRLKRKKFQTVSSSDLVLVPQVKVSLAKCHNIGKNGSRRRLKSSFELGRADAFVAESKEVGSYSVLRLNDLGNLFNPFKKKVKSNVELGRESVADSMEMHDFVSPKPANTTVNEPQTKLERNVHFTDESHTSSTPSVPSWCYDATLRKAAMQEWSQTLSEYVFEKVTVKVPL